MASKVAGAGSEVYCKSKMGPGQIVKIANCLLMSPVGPGNATLNDEEVNNAIHTITKNLPIYQNHYIARG